MTPLRRHIIGWNLLTALLCMSLAVIFAIWDIDGFPLRVLGTVFVVSVSVVIVWALIGDDG